MANLDLTTGQRLLLNRPDWVQATASSTDVRIQYARGNIVRYMGNIYMYVNDTPGFTGNPEDAGNTTWLNLSPTIDTNGAFLLSAEDRLIQPGQSIYYDLDPSVQGTQFEVFIRIGTPITVSLTSGNLPTPNSHDGWTHLSDEGNDVSISGRIITIDGTNITVPTINEPLTFVGGATGTYDGSAAVEITIPTGSDTPTPTLTNPRLDGPATHDFSDTAVLTFTVIQNDFLASTANPITNITLDGTTVTPTITGLTFTLPASGFVGLGDHTVTATYTDTHGNAHTVRRVVNTIQPVLQMEVVSNDVAANIGTGNIVVGTGTGEFENTGQAADNGRPFSFTETGQRVITIAYPAATTVTWHNQLGDITPTGSGIRQFNGVSYNLDQFTEVTGNFRITMET